jgi:hypothetical protein
MNNLNKYYKVSDGSCFCVVETLEQAQEMAAEDSDWNYEDYLLEIEEVFMTEEEFNDLDEFEGF